MIILTFFIVISVGLYVYYKVAILKSKDELEQLYFNGRSRMCLGTFLVFFAVNQYIFYKSQVSLFIGLLFIALGLLQFIRGFKESQHYRKEWRRLNPHS